MDLKSEKINGVFPKEALAPDVTKGGDLKTATVGSGCFWCVEAVFQDLEGVLKVESGYAGGALKNPTYKDICTGTTGHAEVCQITYDPSKITLDQLLAVFWQTHDPTTLNRQGNDVGTQYRSVVFYQDEAEKQLMENYIQALNQSGAWENPVVTTVERYTVFYPAEAYHQNYYNQNSNQGYCQFVIRPKVDKFREVFAGKLRK